MTRISAAIFAMWALICGTGPHAATIVNPEASPLWEGHEVKVCFEKRSQPLVLPTQTWSLEMYKLAVARRITSEFRRAGIAVIGWGDCAATDTTSIRINLTLDGLQSNPHVQYIGNEIAGVKNGVNLVYPTRESPEWYPLTTALHEFMHAIGFHHEQERADATTCKENQSLKGESSQSMMALGDYDPYSIMNYCLYDQYAPPSTHEQGLATDALLARLTESDVIALRHVFTGPLTFLKDVRRTFPARGLELEVDGIRATSFSYKILDTLGDSCNSTDGYSAPQVLGSKLVFQRTPGAQVKICLRGHSALAINETALPSVFVWGNSSSVLIPGSIDFVTYSTERVLDSISADRYKIAEAQSDCLKAQGYQQVLGDQITLTPSKWLSPEATEGVLCVKKGFASDSENFFVIQDGAGFSIAARDGHKLELIPNLVAGHLLSFRFAQINSTEQCPLDQKEYSAPISADTTITVDLREGETICGLAMTRDSGFTKPKDAQRTDLSGETQID